MGYYTHTHTHVLKGYYIYIHTHTHLGVKVKISIKRINTYIKRKRSICQASYVALEGKKSMCYQRPRNTLEMK